MNETINVGDEVLATYPSGVTYGGQVLMVVQEREKLPQYEVAFCGESHHRFESTNVKKVFKEIDFSI